MRKVIVPGTPEAERIAKSLRGELKGEPVHFDDFDPRFCGTKMVARCFTFDENKVTCPDCKANDRLVITPQGQAFVDSLKKSK